MMDTTVLNDSFNRGTVNLSHSGQSNVVLTGSVIMQDSEVKDSEIINQSTNIDTSTIAIGNEKLSATGSIIINRKFLNNTVIINSSKNINTQVVAEKNQKNALIGSINIYD